MTAQVQEGLRFRDRDTSMAACPLSGAFGPDLPRPAFSGTSSACWRGYVGCWEVRDDLLHLTDLKGQVRDPESGDGRRTKPIGLLDLFPHAPSDGVFADWCTDWLPVRWGKMTRYVHAGFESRYDRELFLGVFGGYLIAVHDVTYGDALVVVRELTSRLDEVFPDHAPFIRAIHVNWADQLPRLVYADWLDERNDPRAELLRVDAALADTPADAGLLTRRAAVLGGVKDWFWMKLVGCDPPKDKYGYEQRTW